MFNGMLVGRLLLVPLCIISCLGAVLSVILDISSHALLKEMLVNACVSVLFLKLGGRRVRECHGSSHAL